MVLISDTDDYDGNNNEYDHDHKYVADMMMMLMINFDENVDCRSLHRKTCARLHSIRPFVRRAESLLRGRQLTLMF